MLPTVIYLFDFIRRALKKSGRGLSMIADTFNDAADQSRATRRRYPFAE